MLKSTLLFPAEHPQEADAPPASPFYADLSWPVSGEGLRGASRKNVFKHVPKHKYISTTNIM